VPPLRYELGFNIPGEGILHSYRRVNLNSYIIGSCTKAVLSQDIDCVQGISEPCRQLTAKGTVCIGKGRVESRHMSVHRVGKDG
jgi:hypothetical protein